MHGWEKWKNEHNSTYFLAIAGWLQYETEFLERFAFVDQLTDVPQDQTDI